jgi:hypothetical protein
MFIRFAAGLIAVTASVNHVTPALAEASTCIAMIGLDSDKDGTIDLAQAQKAAGNVFDKIEHDADKTVDAKEAEGRLSKKEFESADTDNDGTLTKDEYLALVAKRFSAADPDGEGKIDCKELSTPAGEAFLKLVK